MPPGLMSRRKSRHMVWEMGTGTGDWGLGIGDWGIGDWGIGTGNRKVLPPAGKGASP